MIIQKKAVNKVLESRETIMAVRTNIPKIGTNGTTGVFKGRVRPASFPPKNHNPTQTSTKAITMHVGIDRVGYGSFSSRFYKVCIGGDAGQHIREKYI